MILVGQPVHAAFLELLTGQSSTAVCGYLIFHFACPRPQVLACGPMEEWSNRWTFFLLSWYFHKDKEVTFPTKNKILIAVAANNNTRARKHGSDHCGF